MGAKKHVLGLALAGAMLVPSKATARGRVYASVTRDSTPQKQTRRRPDRRPQTLPAVVSPCGRHAVQVVSGVVFVNGRRVHPASGAVYLLSRPAWRPDGRAVAWVERAAGEARLIVVPDVGVAKAPAALPWALPAGSIHDQVFWAAPTRVVVGPALLAPRAVASWTETIH